MAKPDKNTIVDSEGFEMRERVSGQASLFSPTEFPIPQTLKSWKKGIAALHSVPVKAEHSQSLIIRKLMDAAILVVQLDFGKRKPEDVERIRAERITPLFEVSVSDLCKLGGIPPKRYTLCYAALEQIYEMDLHWNIIGEVKELEWKWRSHFFSSYGKGEGSKRGMVRFSFSPEVLDLILEPAYWASLSLKAQRSLTISSAYALYQNTWKYIGTDHKKTATLPVETWVELLCGRSRYIKEENGKITLNYKDFKRYILIPAIEQVNSLPALSYTLELIEYKRIKRVEKIQFRFVEKSRQLSLPSSWPADVFEALSKLGMDEGSVKELAEAHSLDQVSDALDRLKEAQRRLKDKGKGITSIKAYFLGILGKLSVGDVDEIDHEKLEVEIQRKAAEDAASNRKEKMAEMFAKHRSECLANWLNTMPDDELSGLFSEFGKTVEGQKLSIVRRTGKGRIPGMAYIRGLLSWLEINRPEQVEEAFQNPEDRSIEAWMAWRLEGGGAIDA